MTLRHIYRLNIAALLLPLVLLASCGGGGTHADLPTSDGPRQISAEWLRQQAGVTAGDYSVHLLDANNQPLPWRGLEVQRNGDTLTINATGDPPAAAYIYVAYPSAQRAFDNVELPLERQGDYIAVAAAGRIPDVLPLALARIAASRGRSLRPGLLVRLRFAPGAERQFRSTSAVSDDPSSAPVLSLGAPGGGTVQLLWDERNLGDYDNNGLVTISDLTPLGGHFGAAVNGDPNLLVIDGDGNGELNIADIAKIGRNFGTDINGYQVVRKVGGSQTGQWTVARADILAATPAAQLKQRLHYTFDAPITSGSPNDFYVQATGSGNSTGPTSNTVTYIAGSSNQAPMWDTSEGITSVTPVTGGLVLTFGHATDPEAELVDYVLRYNVAPFAPGAADATEVVIPGAVVAGSAPYTYTLSGLTAGTTYNLRLQARDPEGNYSSNTTVQSGAVPVVALSPDLWSCPRGNPMRDGYTGVTTGNGPLDIAWSKPQNPPYSIYISEPLVHADGSVTAFDDTGAPWTYKADGTVQVTPTAGPGNSSYPCCFGGVLGQSQSVFNIWDNTGLSFTSLNPGFNIPGSGLLLGDYVMLPGTDRFALMLRSGLAPEWTSAPTGDFYDNMLAATDGTYLYTIGQHGLVQKLDILTGAVVQSRQLTLSVDLQKGILLDAQRGQLLFVPADNALQVLDASDLSDKQTFDDHGEYSWYCWPCLALQASPPLAVMVTTAGPLPNPGTMTVRAYDLTNLTESWSTVIQNAQGCNFVCASADRIFVNDQTKVHVLDLSGVLRQTIDTGTMGMELAPTDSGFVIQTPTGVTQYGPAASDLAPVWQGVSAKPGGGIRSLTETGGQVTANWDYATDDHGAPVYYALYWRVGYPPEFDNPGPGTNVVTGLADSGTGTNSYTFDPQTTDRVYVGVRAYDAPWDQNPKVDSNTNWLALTPGWDREELVLGTDLPAGKAFFMRGFARGNGTLTLAYNDFDSAELTYVNGTTGNWNTVEQSSLAGWPTPGFDAIAAANGGTWIGICDADAAVLKRTGANTWSRQAVQGNTDPVVNPQISIARSGASAALAYTELVSGSYPFQEEHYFGSIWDGTNWLASEDMDDQNYSGRDISMVYSENMPTALYQRGGNYSPNRITPEDGYLCWARWDGSAWNANLLDTGSNQSGGSDCGKRAHAVVNGNIIHLAYLDLDADASTPTGQLKYATYDPATGWSGVVLSQFDLGFQTGSTQYTWGELGIALSGGEPVVAYLQRNTSPLDTLPHLVSAFIFDHRSGNWTISKLSDLDVTIPTDREPCILLNDTNNKLHLFYTSSTHTLVNAPEPDKLVHIYEK